MIPKLVAHRGYMNAYPENTILSISEALKACACMVEFDVQMCADKELVVLHDDNLNRTAGLNKSVFDLDSKELSGINVNQPDLFGNKYTGVTVPVLSQVMSLFNDYAAAKALVEIKDESLDRWGLEVVMDKLHKQLEAFPGQSIVIGYNENAIASTKRHGIYKTGWVLTKFDDESLSIARQLQPDYIICNHKKITSELWQGNWDWMLYDIVDPDLALEWAGKGAAFIETAEIGEMLKHEKLSKESCADGI